MPKLQRDDKGYSLESRRLKGGDVVLVSTGGDYHGIVFPDPMPVTIVFDKTGNLHFKASAAPLDAREIEIPFDPEEDLFSWRSEGRA